MGENNESNDKILEDLAIITDKIQTIHPRSKSTIIFELDDYEFAKTKKNFNIFDDKLQRFKIDISGTEIVFLSENVFLETDEVEEEKISDPEPEPEPKKLNWFLRIFSNRK